MRRKRLAILIASDRVYYGEAETFGGQLIREIAEKKGFEVVSISVLPLNRDGISGEIMRIADGRKAELILTLGGTGMAAAECVPEATAAACPRLLPGVTQMVRLWGTDGGQDMIFGRMSAGIRFRTIVVNLPQSEQAIRENTENLLSRLEEGIRLVGEYT